ncbi:mCG1031442, isoform CRA_b, partial [Mus musculus]
FFRVCLRHVFFKPIIYSIADFHDLEERQITDSEELRQQKDGTHSLAFTDGFLVCSGT